MQAEQLGKKTARKLHIRLFFLGCRWIAKVEDKCLFDYYLKNCNFYNYIQNVGVG